MIKSIIYKEWLKIRWAIIGAATILLLGAVHIFLTLRHDLSATEATNYWYNVIFMNLSFFNILKFIPAAVGLSVAAFQYVPEVTDKRIKLSLHLPLNEDRMLLSMHLFGTCCLLTVFVLFLLTFTFVSSLFFPAELTIAALQTILPWILSGLAAYFLAATIILEPLWKFRALFAIISFGFLKIFFERALMKAYAGMNSFLIIITLLLSIAVIYSGYRFRKGEM